MADMNFGVNIIPTTSSVTLGNSDHPWHAPTPEEGTSDTQVATAEYVGRSVIKPITIELDDVSGDGGYYTHTTNIVTEGLVTEGMEPQRIEVSDPNVFRDRIVVTCGNNTVTLSCNKVIGASTVKVMLMKSTPDAAGTVAPAHVTSEEFDILNDRLMAVENVCAYINITIHAADWSDIDPYTYVWESPYITQRCAVIVYLLDGAEASGISEFDYEKTSGGVQFTTSETPSGDLPVQICIANTKMDDVIELSKTIDIPFTIASSSWSSTSPYTSTWTSEYITENCGVTVDFYSGSNDSSVAYLGYEKTDGGIIFTAPVLPVSDISVCAHIMNTANGTAMSVTGDAVATSVIDGAVNVDEALSILDGDIATLGKIRTYNVTSSNLSFTISLPNSTRYIVFMCGTDTTTRSAACMLGCNSSGTASVLYLYQGSKISHVRSGNSVTFTRDAGSIQLIVIPLLNTWDPVAIS